MARVLVFIAACAALGSQPVTQAVVLYERAAWHTGQPASWQHVGVAAAVLAVYTGGWQVWARVRGARVSG